MSRLLVGPETKHVEVCVGFFVFLAVFSKFKFKVFSKFAGLAKFSVSYYVYRLQVLLLLPTV